MNRHTFDRLILNTTNRKVSQFPDSAIFHCAGQEFEVVHAIVRSSDRAMPGYTTSEQLVTKLDGRLRSEKLTIEWFLKNW